MDIMVLLSVTIGERRQGDLMVLIDALQ